MLEDLINLLIIRSHLRVLWCVAWASHLPFICHLISKMNMKTATTWGYYQTDSDCAEH